LLQPISHGSQLGGGAPEAPYRLAVALLRYRHIVGFVANINARGIRMDHFQAEVFALELPHHLPPLLAVHFLPLAPPGAGGWLAFFLLLGFHASPPMLNSTGLGPVGETFTISPSGSGLSPYSGQRRHHLHNRQTRSHA